MSSYIRDATSCCPDCGSFWRECSSFECCRRKSVPRKRRSSVAEAEEALENVESLEKPIGFGQDPRFLPLTFVPNLIVEEILTESFRVIPYQIKTNAVILIADVCGFTSLTETYCQKGTSGIEELARVLNGYMSMLAAMLLNAGGDILNFAGDAFLVYWEDSKDAVEKAYNCAVDLQTHRCLQARNLGGTLQAKIGIGKGSVVTWILGSPQDFLLFVTAGHGIAAAHQAEEMCSSGDIIVSKDVFSILQTIRAKTFTTTELLDGFVKISDYESITSEEPHPERKKLFESCMDEHITVSKIFLIPSLRDLQTEEELSYISELTMVSILFISLKNIDVEEPQTLDKTFDIVLACAKLQGGILNKMLLFDKGCTYLVVFGLPGQKHADDAARSLICANDIINRHDEIQLEASVGVATGTCYCGMVGHPLRQEYTVIGNRVNLAARIMVKYQEEPIVLDSTTYHLSRQTLGDDCFYQLPAKKMKGIESAGRIYAYRIRSKKVAVPESSVYILESPSVAEGEDGKGKLVASLKSMLDEEERSNILSTTLLPVIIVEGPSNSGKSYYTYYAVNEAEKMGYKICCCCTMEDTRLDPFLTIGLLVQRMLKMSPLETTLEREQKVLEALPLAFDPQLFLLNHLFHVQFPAPEIVNIDEDFIRNETLRLFKVIFREFAGESPLLIAIDNADDMDEYSWLLLRHLAEEGQFVLLLSLAQDHREPSVAASLLSLKAHTRVKIEDSSEDYYGSLICFFLGVKAVHKELFHYLKEKTKGNTQILQEVLLSPQVAEFTHLVPFESLGEEESKFFVSEFPVPTRKSLGTVLALDKKEGIDLKKMKIASSIDDAVKDSFTYLTVQDRLLLKRAAILGSVFDQHVLEVVSHGLTTKQVCQSINHLLQKNILAFACTSGVILEKLPSKDPFKHLECYNICFCSKVYSKSPFRDCLGPHCHAGPYSRLIFRTKVYRLCILSYMTKEQYDNMRREIINELEVKGLNCISCRIKRTESVQMEFAMGDMRCAPLQTDMKQCACLEKQPKTYHRLAYIHATHGNKLHSIYFTKKRAQASNTIGYPVQALTYASQAERMLPESPVNVTETTGEEDSHLNILALKASIKRTMAKSALLLGSYYYAAFYVQRALALHDMDTVYFYGVLSPMQFKNVLKGYPLLQAESITATIGILSTIYVSAGKYKQAKKILETEFVALSYYPIDFLQILQFMISLYQSQRLTKPRKKFKNLENNLIGICRQRLQKYDCTLNSLDIRYVGIAYVCVIEMNVTRGNLKRAEKIGGEAMKFLEYINDQRTMPKIHINLLKIHMHENRYFDCFPILENLKNNEKELNSEDWALYYCFLIIALIYKFKGVGDVSTEDKASVDDCNEFACIWMKHWFPLFRVDLAFYISTVLAVWCLKVVNRVEWSEAHLYFDRCYGLAGLLSEKLRSHSYWSVSASFIYSRIQLSLEDRYANTLKFVAIRNAILSRLQQMKKSVKTDFPVFMKKYEILIHDLSFLNPDQMLDSL